MWGTPSEVSKDGFSWWKWRGKRKGVGEEQETEQADVTSEVAGRLSSQEDWLCIQHRSLSGWICAVWAFACVWVWIWCDGHMWECLTGVCAYAKLERRQVGEVCLSLGKELHGCVNTVYLWKYQQGQHRSPTHPAWVLQDSPNLNPKQRKDLLNCWWPVLLGGGGHKGT